MRVLFFLIFAVLLGCGDVTQETTVINLPPIFNTANSQSEREGDVLVLVEDATLFEEKTTETDWGNNTSESNMDYTSGAHTFSPDAGDVILTEFSGMWVCDVNTNKIYNIKTIGTSVSSFLTSVFDASATDTRGVDYAPDDTLWVCDNNTDKIYNIQTDGTLISSFATSVYDASTTGTLGITYSPDDNVIAISITNFYPNWTSIKAKASFSAIIDNFIINYADAIVESEI